MEHICDEYPDCYNEAVIHWIVNPGSQIYLETGWILVLDEGAVPITFCPFCGLELPPNICY